MKLEQVATILRNGINPREIDGKTKYVGLENIESGGRIIDVSTAEDAGLESQKYQFASDHILYGKLRPYLAKIARPNFNGVCSTDILPIAPKSDIDRDYLYHFLSQPSMISMANSRTTGANLPRIKPAELASFIVPVPPFTEQRRIAEVLDQVDALREKRRKSIALLDDLAQSIFLDMFGTACSDWPVTTVENLAAPRKNSIRTGPFGSQLLHEEFVDDGVAVLGIDNAVANEFRWSRRRYITAAKYKQLERYTVFPGDVLITIMGTCGRCAVVPEDIPTAINTKHLCCITLDRGKCAPEYLHSYFLQHPAAQRYLRQKAKGAIMSGLNMGIIKSLPVTIPPLQLQIRYAEQVRSVRESRATAERHLAHLDTLSSSLQSRAFRGELWQDDLKDL
ncbi:restriction endonuclease subunit S [Nocardia cyriacigeorgica]|uniref:restriction endonuclease subunit S n=1 Tax=Nocardia cyriacigeorgica TaxID=135487 RepID=UPI0018936823|nr:restriction endonuclease subunit S [Nocardia cyriacigeorgica]MBF6398891.1 restriction endonuclease subunit S [Nocardia cyriacigeorgica]MBF6403595.1 restriction endonuclease subunit S [Nocardia cyriacigeorgica]